LGTRDRIKPADSSSIQELQVIVHSQPLPAHILTLDDYSLMSVDSIIAQTSLFLTPITRH
jgi:hypothetical protein